MKRILVFLLVGLFSALRLSAQTPVHICIPTHATPQERQAADWLHAHILGSTIEAETASPDTAQALAIFVGRTHYADSSLSRLEELRDDGFRLRSNGRVAAICGNKEKSVLYGTARLLELMGHFMTWIDYHPQPSAVSSLPVVDEVSNPSFAHREMWYYAPYHSQMYADWHGLNFRSDLHWADNMFVHTFQKLIPQQVYFDSHPEWFSEINGRRVRDGQLCLSNPEVLDTLCAHLSDSIAAHPEAKIWSVSNNDNVNGCQCAACRHADSLYGGPSGTLIHFINQVARRFPGKTISTLAYQYTRHAPRLVGDHVERPDSNVNIMFCSIECGREKSLEHDPAFSRDMQDWSALTSNIYMWDYVVQFRNFWDPFPNLHVLQPNLQFFADNGVQWMFEQGTGGHNVTSWMELRQYLLAKLMWNVDADVHQLTRDFLTHYYGAASAPIARFFDEIHTSLRQSGQRLDIYGYPIDAAEGYLSPEQIEVYQDLFRIAYDSVPADDTLLRDRVRFLELSLDFARIELTMAGVMPMDEGFRPLVDHFLADAQRLGVNSLHEMGYSLQQYRDEIDNFLAKTTTPNLARNCPVQLRSLPQPRYFAMGEEGLTDGRCGSLDFRNRWLGFNPDTLDAVIDLGRRKRITQVSLDFFFYPLAWIFLPQRIEYYCSNNGEDWELIETICPENPERLANPLIYTFASKSFRRRARYVRVVAVPLSAIPTWHRATGSHPWIFTDEILVR